MQNTKFFCLKRNMGTAGSFAPYASQNPNATNTANPPKIGPKHFPVAQPPEDHVNPRSTKMTPVMQRTEPT